MLKLMKYEFRKQRTVLLALLIALVALELGFVLGHHFEKADVAGVCLALLTVLGFGTYAYLMVAGIVSYSRELTNRTGYLTFMTPVRPIGIVLSKLVSTLLMGIGATALFALAAYLDYAYLFRTFNITEDALQQLNFGVRMVLGNMSFDINQVWLFVACAVAVVLIQVMLAMCTAYLSITLSATLLQNNKGFVRALISVLLFFAINYGAGKINSAIIETSPALRTPSDVLRVVGITLAVNLALSAVFAVISAYLLKKKVSL